MSQIIEQIKMMKKDLLKMKSFALKQMCIYVDNDDSIAKDSYNYHLGQREVITTILKKFFNEE